MKNEYFIRYRIMGTNGWGEYYKIVFSESATRAISGLRSGLGYEADFDILVMNKL